MKVIIGDSGSLVKVNRKLMYTTISNHGNGVIILIHLCI